jgi:predicted permease
MAEEMRLHIEHLMGKSIANGLSPEEARYAAQRRFGGIDQFKEQCRDGLGWRLLEEFIRDLCFGARVLMRNSGFTAVAILTLALCIGANLAIFAVVDALLIRSLPFPRADRLLTIYYTYPHLPGAINGASLTNYYERKGKFSSLESLAEIGSSTSVIGEPGATTVEDTGRVTPEFFDTLGVHPFMGRFFTESEMTYQTDQVAILSYEYWKNAFAGDPAILGRSVRMDATPRKVVGVLPPGFRFLSLRAPVYTPMSSDKSERGVDRRHEFGRMMVARLRDGATVAEARAQIAADDTETAAEYPYAKLIEQAGCYSVVAPLQADYVSSIRPTLLLLQAGALFLLVIGGVNLVNLMLIRASNRSRELAIRRALGASNGNIVREVMAESVLLTVTGGVFGLLVGAAGIQLLAALGSHQLPLGAEIAFNGRLACVALAGAALTGFIVGMPVAWFNLHGGLAGALHAESRGSTASRTTRRLRHGFIVTQVALAFVLLIGASLLGLSLRRAMAVAPGFSSERVITGRFSLIPSHYNTDDQAKNFFKSYYEKALAIPGVSAVGMVSRVPVVGYNDNVALNVPGYVPKPGEDPSGVHDLYGVGGDYFKAMGIPLIEGRFLDMSDSAKDEYYAVVDEAFARHYWPEGGAVGKKVYAGLKPYPGEKPYVIVGVVGTIKQDSPASMIAPHGALYVTFEAAFYRNYYVVARTTLPPEVVGAALAKVLRDVDPDLPLSDIKSMDTRIADSLSTRRSPALMAGIFGVVALLLASIGLYGVMAYAVVQRTREFGVRLALGAQRSDVLRMVFLEGARLAALGLALGAAISLAAASFISSFLFGVTSHDPIAYAGVGAVLAAVASVACLLPAQRATAVDPIVALRAD